MRFYTSHFCDFFLWILTFIWIWIQLQAQQGVYSLGHQWDPAFILLLLVYLAQKPPGIWYFFFFWHMDPTSGVTRGFIPWVRSEIKPLFILLFLSLPGSKVTKGFSLYFGIFPFVPGSKTTNSNSLISSSPKMFFFFQTKTWQFVCSILFLLLNQKFLIFWPFWAFDFIAWGSIDLNFT